MRLQKNEHKPLLLVIMCLSFSWKGTDMQDDTIRRLRYKMLKAAEDKISHAENTIRDVTKERYLRSVSGVLAGRIFSEPTIDQTLITAIEQFLVSVDEYVESCPFIDYSEHIRGPDLRYTLKLSVRKMQALSRRCPPIGMTKSLGAKGGGLVPVFSLKQLEALDETV
jgi:hypothetical protein